MPEAPRPADGRRRIVVRLHEREDRFGERRYLLPLLMGEWEAMGLEVATVRGPSPVAPADLVFLHVDLTVLPPEYADRGDRVVNGRTRDISKSRISGLGVGRASGHAGPVIVKTDRNCGGLPDKRLLPADASRRLLRLAAGTWQRATGRPLWRWIDYLDPDDYGIYPSLREVPRGVFRNPRLVVERFLPETDGDAFCVRYCYFLGDREFSLRLKSRSGIVKASNAFLIEETATPEGIRGLRRRLGFDYGKFDYALRDGEVLLYDANRTPGTDTLRIAGLTERVARHLAPGVLPLLG